MNAPNRIRTTLRVGLGVAAIMLAGCSNLTVMQYGETVSVDLRGSEEAPPVTTGAWGYGVISVDSDHSVKGSITVSGLSPIAAHIHVGGRGTNGPVIVGLVNKGENVWAVPAGAAISTDQLLAFKAGNLYINVHTEAHKGGEIRGQLLP